MAILGFFYLVPFGDELLTFSGRMALGVLIAAVYLWVTEPIPLAVTGLLAMIVMPAFGILDFNGVWSGWMSSVIFFVLSSFALTKALIKSKIPSKVVFFLVSLSKGRASLVVLAFMITTAFVSMFVSNVPVTAVFAAMAASTILEAEKAVPGKSKLGVALMIGVVFASRIGGLCTPVGNAMNIMVLGMLTGFSGITITFLDWMAIAMPVAIILLPLSWIALVLIFKPEAIKPETLDYLKIKKEELGKLAAFDYKVIAVFLLMLLLWLGESIFHIDATVVCVIGMIIMFLPGIEILTWKEYVDTVAWDIVLVIGSVSSISAGVSASGAAKWLVSTATGMVALTATGLTIGAAALIPILRLFIPVAPAIIGLITMPLLGLSAEAGVSLTLMAMLISFGTVQYLLAIDAMTLMAYKYNYFSIIQYFFAGIAPTIITFILCITIMPWLCGALGL
jgi:sodium-dependent dicarboxylate transporter 2/3/5